MMFKEPRRALSWIEDGRSGGAWREGNPSIMGPFTHGAWMGAVAFDGARAFRGLTPDLDLHCARAVRSALALGLAPRLDAAAIEAIAREGIAQFPPEAELYIRPVIYSEDGFIVPEPASTRVLVSVIEAPLPNDRRHSACLSTTQRPAPAMAVTDAKCAALYSNIARAMREARARGFDTAVVLDPWDNVAELATANLFCAREGRVLTPKANGTFLAGITRARAIALLRAAGVAVEETTITFDELLAADEVFACGTFAKIVPIVRIEAREFAPGPIAARARALYFDWAEGAARSR